MPLILERKAGVGRVLLANTSSDSAWTDCPKHKTFVPGLHTAGLFLAGRGAAPDQALPPTFVSGGEVDIELGTGPGKKAFNLARFCGRESAVVAEVDGPICDVPIEAAGICSLKESSGREICRSALNLPVPESELFGRSARIAGAVGSNQRPGRSCSGGGLVWRFQGGLGVLDALIIWPIGSAALNVDCQSNVGLNETKCYGRCL